LTDARRSAISDICVRHGSREDASGGLATEPDRLEADLRLALDRGEIGIVYQPQYDSLNDRIVGVEALAAGITPNWASSTPVRCSKRRTGRISCSLSPAISSHVRSIEAGQWPASLSALRLAVNITAVDLAQERLSRLICSK
jgi:EAL domain-containing protein (putative c-di-GMP-specific phosphodiesterase class I)